jgi:DNA topoisomerase-1
VQVDHFTVALDFPGKSGKRHEVEFTDRKVAKVIRQCEEIEGHYLFSYLDEQGRLCQATSTDVNNYLREAAGEAITAKDFRTWWGSVTALDALAGIDERELSLTARKKAIVAAVRQSAALLGNTLAVCRRSYIHPQILTAFEAGTLSDELKKCQRSAAQPRPEMEPAECRFAAWLKSLSTS